MAILRRRAEEVLENQILKIGFRLGHGTVLGPKDSNEVPLVEVDGSKMATYCGWRSSMWKAERWGERSWCLTSLFCGIRL
jgi:hypothetical protein